jgi:hypothetical protein
VASLSDLDRVKSVLGPPADAAGRPVEVAPADWSEVREYLGLRLPKSFTDFVDCYGSGVLGLIYFSRPEASPAPPLHSGTDLLYWIESGKGYLRQKRDRKPPWNYVPYPVHPEPGGLIQWGGSWDEYQFFFRADPAHEPERWPIIWHDVAFDEWHEFPGPFGGFLLDLVTGRMPSEIVGEGLSYGVFDPSGPGIETRPNAGHDPDYVPTAE